MLDRDPRQSVKVKQRRADRYNDKNQQQPEQFEQSFDHRRPSPAVRV
jgi:hypothetical protein